ncbi:hypothetical protein GQ457_04G030100 [Hibiscus cannabinus]
MEKKLAECDEWNFPHFGFVKFNIDGAVKGSYGLAGIGGVLRDHSGKILAEFSKSIGFADPTSAEILAIKEALITFASSEWNKKVELIIETDCETAVFWINNPNTTPFTFKDLVNECLSIGSNLYWKLCWTRREGNVKADRLAKAGIEPGLKAAC